MIDNASKLPSDVVCFANGKLSNIEFNSGDIARITLGANPNKYCGNDKITLPMMKICDKPSTLNICENF